MQQLRALESSEGEVTSLKKLPQNKNHTGAHANKAQSFKHVG